LKKYMTLSVAYIAGLVGFVYWKGVAPATANEWGDYFAGFVAPLALVWFIGTLLLQRKELALQRDELVLQREEMKLTREVLEKQGEQQLRTAEATLEANKIAASTAFADSVPEHIRLLDSCLSSMRKTLPKRVMVEMDGEKKSMSLQTVDGPGAANGYFFALLQRNVGVENSGFDDKQKGAITSYLRTFDAFREKATATNNLIYILGPYHDAWSEMRAFMNEDS